MGRKRKDGKFVNCYLSSNLVEVLDVAADETGKSKTRIIEDALTDYFVKYSFMALPEVSSVTRTELSEWIPQSTEGEPEPVREESLRGDTDNPIRGASAILSTAEGDIYCTILEELSIYGEPYYRVQTDDGVKKVHQSLVRLL